MKFTLFDSKDSKEVVRLFIDVFSASDGLKEGSNIGHLVENLIIQTPSDDVLGFVARNEKRILGAIFFSRFVIPNGAPAFILSPVAVSTHVQGMGLGQQLIRFGLDELRTRGVSLVFTYGDPAFYLKTQFKQISEAVVKAPFELSQPVGWLAQSLDGKPIEPMIGDTQCVQALSDPNFW